jgi:hypothetical protein
MKTLMLLGAPLCCLGMAVWMWRAYTRGVKPSRALRAWLLCLLPVAVFLAVLIAAYPMPVQIARGHSLIELVLTVLFIPALFGAAAFAGGGLALLALSFLSTPVDPEARERARKAFAKRNDDECDKPDWSIGGPCRTDGPWTHGGPYGGTSSWYEWDED